MESRKIIIEHIEKIKLYTTEVISFIVFYGTHRCGYIAIPKDSKLSELEYYESSTLIAHGGITFEDTKYRGLELDKEYKIIGYDCAHFGDKFDLHAHKDIFGKEQQETIEIYSRINRISEGSERKKTFCIEENNNILAQLYILDSIGNYSI